MQSRTTHTEEGPAGPHPGIAQKERQVLSRRNLLGTLGIAAAGGALSMLSIEHYGLDGAVWEP